MFSIVEELKKDGKKRVILDSDTYNEIDDQFALALTLVSRDKIDLVCVCAAPFYNSKSESFEDGMERSYNEIKVCSSFVNETHGVPVPLHYRGSRARMPDENTPVNSEAAEAIYKHVAEYDGITYVIAIGAITNVASAILLHPEISEKMAVIWLGGHAKWFDGREFNLVGDRCAANALFASKVPLLLFPCRGVVSHLSTTIYELEHFLRGNSPLGDYLCDNVAECEPKNAVSWSRVIWDVSTVCAVIDPGSFSASPCIRPHVEPDYKYTFDMNYGTMEHVDRIDRDRMMSIMFKRLMK